MYRRLPTGSPPEIVRSSLTLHLGAYLGTERMEKQELESENAQLWREHPEGVARLVLALGAGVAF